MTYEELIVAIAADAPRLKHCALRLLIHLIARCIEAGSNELAIPHRQLADELRVSKETIGEAFRNLEDIVTVERVATVVTKTILPADWFSPQQSLFMVPEARAGRPRLCGNATQTVLETRTELSWKPGQTGRKTRTDCPGNQDKLGGKPGQIVLETRTTVPETRTVYTQNQQLAGDSLDRSSRVLDSFDSGLLLRDSIEGVNCIPEDLRGDAAELKTWLRGYFKKHGKGRTPPPGPDEILLGKCLALAPLRALIQTLQLMHQKNTGAGDGWAWFVTVFCDRIHKTKNLASVQAPPGFHKPKKPPQGEYSAEFTSELLQQSAAGVHQLR